MAPMLPSCAAEGTAADLRPTPRSWQGRCLLLLLALVWLMPAAFAQAEEDPAILVPPGPIELRGENLTVPLADRSMYWVDRGGELGIDDIEASQHTLPWAIRHEGNITALGEQDALWIQFDAWVRDTASHWELELSRTGTDLAVLYYRGPDGAWHRQQAGDRLPVSQWHARDRFPVFTLNASTGKPQRYWLRIEHARVPYAAELYIHAHGKLREHRILEHFLLGGYFGLALLLVLTALFNGIVFRDKSFLAYAIYTGLMAFTMSVGLGVAGQMLWPGHAGWGGQAEFLLLPVTGMAGLLFIREVFQSRRIHRRLDHAVIFTAMIWCVTVAWDQLLPSVASLRAISIVGGLVMALTAVILAVAWRTGEHWARWVVLGFVPVLLGGMTPVLRNFHLLSAGFLSQYGLVAAAALEAPILLYGLMKRSSMQHEAQARARALELTEPLTGLTNRHNCILRLHDSLVRAQRYHHQSALLVINLDNHDWFQEKHGREVADRALVLTGSLLRSVARDVDTAARIDDQTFALLMEGPVRGPEAVSAATAILAGGLRPSPQLPVGAALRYKIVVALLPDPSIDVLMDAQQHLAWLHDEANALHWDKQRNIATVNF